jgi:hypothetical protein
MTNMSIGDDFFKTIKFEHKEDGGVWRGEVVFQYDAVTIYACDSEKVYHLHPIWVLDMSIPHVLVRNLLVIENGVMEATKVKHMLSGNTKDEKAFRMAVQNWLVSIDKELAIVVAPILEEQWAFYDEQQPVGHEDPPFIKSCKCGKTIPYELHMCSSCDLEEINERHGGA